MTERKIEKIEIVVTRIDGKKCIIPLTTEEVSDLCELTYMISDETWNIIKLNKVDLGSIFKKIEFLEHDVVNEGKYWTFDKKKKEMVMAKDNHYLIEEPKWVLKEI